MTSALDRNTPRTCTPENAGVAINGDNSEPKATLVAELAIDPVTEQVDFSHSVPIDSYLANPALVRENMQQLLDMILGFFESESQKVENGELKKRKCYLTLMYKNSTQIPNILLDYDLKVLTSAELKILLVIMHQTHGWIDKYTKARKTRDRISHSQFMDKTGLSRRIISQTIPKLQTRGLIACTDRIGKSLSSGRERAGRTQIQFN